MAKIESFNEEICKKYFPEHLDKFNKSKYLIELHYYLDDNYSAAERTKFWTTVFELMLDYSKATPMERLLMDLKLNKNVTVDSSAVLNMFAYLSSRAVQEIFQNKIGFSN